MSRVFDVFQQAPQLGSLIDLRQEKGSVFEAGCAELQPLLVKTLANINTNPDLRAVGVAAEGITRAVELLLRHYTLVATNVPYLAQRKHAALLKTYLAERYPKAKADLATAMTARCWSLLRAHGTVATVTPSSWLFLTGFKHYRSQLLETKEWNFLARLGPGAFESISGEVVNVVLWAASQTHPVDGHLFGHVDCMQLDTPAHKAESLIHHPLVLRNQRSNLSNPDSRITESIGESSPLLSSYAWSLVGIQTGDYPRFIRNFWELAKCDGGWDYYQRPPENDNDTAGRSEVILWQNGKGELYQYVSKRLGESGVRAWLRGWEAWGKTGVAVSLMRGLKASLYRGDKYDQMIAVLIPKKKEHLIPILAFCESSEFRESVRRIDQSIKVTNDTLTKVPFDLDLWSRLAPKQLSRSAIAEESNNPVDWLFIGEIATSTAPLQVAVAHLLGYWWPEQPRGESGISKVADSDGIVCLPGVRGESVAAERLLEVFHTAYRGTWSDSMLHSMLRTAGSKAGSTIDDWLRNQFFEQHYMLFHNRPFIWHVWDGRKHGFAALVNYHKLTHKALENLTYSYLGDWIATQSKSDKTGADLRLAAAQSLQEKLKLILAGEPPYDIFVRWKPLHEQAIGWNPDLNDGVRMNIRPFMQAGILRKNPNIKWTKDRGKEPLRDQADYPWFWSGDTFVGDRVNDIHLTNAVKEAARKRRKGSPS